MEWKPEDLFDLSHTLAAPLLMRCGAPWEALTELGTFLTELGKELDPGRFEQRAEQVWIARTAVIAPNVTICGPCIIGEKTELRPGAYLRGNVLVGDGCVVGNSTELKNCVLSDGVQVPHYNYVGDSILGYRAHLGAGAITSNVKSDKDAAERRGAPGAKSAAHWSATAPKWAATASFVPARYWGGAAPFTLCPACAGTWTKTASSNHPTAL